MELYSHAETSTFWGFTDDHRAGCWRGYSCKHWWWLRSCTCACISLSRLQVMASKLVFVFFGCFFGYVNWKMMTLVVLTSGELHGTWCSHKLWYLILRGHYLWNAMKCPLNAFWVLLGTSNPSRNCQWEGPGRVSLGFILSILISIFDVSCSSKYHENFEMKTKFDRIFLVRAVEATMGVIDPRSKATLLQDDAWFKWLEHKSPCASRL